MTSRSRSPHRTTRPLAYAAGAVLIFLLVTALFHGARNLPLPELNQSNIHDTEDEHRLHPNPAGRHMELKQLMLRLTNERRTQAGVPPLRLAHNPAAQLHAEASLAGCYSAHWDRWGLKPNHRYTLAGGTGSDAENIAGLDYCIRAEDRYHSMHDMEKEVRETVESWMGSTGHRASLLHPAHTVMNAGIAHSRFNKVLVQQFSSDYVTYQTRPAIDERGILRVQAHVTGATMEIGRTTNLQVWFDPPPKPLSRGQLAHTYGVCPPRQVAYLAPAPPPGRAYTGPELKTWTQHSECTEPLEVSRDVPPPRTIDEAMQAWKTAKDRGITNGTSVTTRTRRVTTPHLSRSPGQLTVEADLSQVIWENGPGVYTVVIWGRPLHLTDPVPLSVQAIFLGTSPPPGNPYGGG